MGRSESAVRKSGSLTAGPQRKRVCCLYRVSTKGQVDKDDIPMQKQRCHEFADTMGWNIVKEFSEKGVSGFKVSAKDRDAIQDTLTSRLGRLKRKTRKSARPCRNSFPRARASFAAGVT